METILEFARAIGGILAVLAIWFGIQAFIRSRSGCAASQDVLDHLKHGCAGCKGDGACHNRLKEEDHHELA